jgi:predicted signal transduction protein with EAL and GGDEF domain
VVAAIEYAGGWEGGGGPLLRARRTAACTRAVLGIAGIALLAAHPALLGHPALGVAGFATITASALIQLSVPRVSWLRIEESLAGAAAVLIVGLQDQRVTILSVLWLAAVASGVVARGGRVHWIGRTIVLSALALPIVLEGRLSAEHAALCLATIGLLLSCGRLTRELGRLLRQARYDADHDELTGTLSRAAFRSALERATASARESSPVCLLLLDLDGFGVVNKALGHAAGDALLAAAGERMLAVASEPRPGLTHASNPARSLRARLTRLVRHDPSPPASAAARPVGRLGGDEFAVMTTVEDSITLAAALLAALAQCSDETRRVSACIGVAQAPRDGTDLDALLRAGDIALRVAKRSAMGGQVSFYAGGPLSGQGAHSARSSLTRLIAGEGLSMAVQPIVDLRSGSVHAYEALARFGQGGTDSPLHWFSLAEEFGERDALERACLRAALELLAVRPEGTRVAVNLSAPVLLDGRTLGMLERPGDLSGLIIEVTEEALVQSEAQLHTTIAPLRARGARLAVDDMGAGYSGLRQITTVQPSYLKLDRSLVSGIDGDGDRAALVSALVGYAEHVGSLLVAEGIENHAELRTLLELGVPLAQGFFLGRPAVPWPHLELGEAKGLPVEVLAGASAAATPAPTTAPAGHTPGDTQQDASGALAAVRAPAGRAPAGVGTPM